MSGHASEINSNLLPAETSNSEVTNLQLIDFKLPPPKELTDAERVYLIRNAIVRIREGAEELTSGAETSLEHANRHGSTELWMLLLVRMVTRVAHPPPDITMGEPDDAPDLGPVSELDFYARQDQQRQTLCDYIMADFPARSVSVF